MYRKTERENPSTLNCPDERARKIVLQKLPLGFLATHRLPCLTVQPLIIIGDGRASEQIPHNARGRFLMEDGTLFQGYYLNESSDS